MTPEQRKQLEEMARAYSQGGSDFSEAERDAFYFGAVAGMDVGTRAERERIAMLMEDCASVIPREVVLKMFNPAHASKEKSE